MWSLIINAGGNSERIKINFPNLVNKCWLEISGIPIIIRNINELNDFIDEIIIVVKNKSMEEDFRTLFQQYERFLSSNHEIKIIADNDLVFLNDTGPCLGIKTGAFSSTQENLLYIPSDLPYLTLSCVKLLNNNLQSNTIVTILSNSYFNPQILAVKRQDLLNLTILPWKRVTDIYRLFPIVYLIKIISEHAELLIGINSLDELEAATNLLSQSKNINKNTDVEFERISLRRENYILNKNLFLKPEESIPRLITEQSYFLATSLIKYHHLEEKFSIIELLKIEMTQWTGINKLISNHCQDDLNHLIKNHS